MGHSHRQRVDGPFEPKDGQSRMPAWRARNGHTGGITTKGGPFFAAQVRGETDCSSAKSGQVTSRGSLELAISIDPL